MSEAYFGLGGLRFWNASEILAREEAVARLEITMIEALRGVNAAWTFRRVEGPILTPRSFVSAAYDESDLFLLQANLGDQGGTLRAETTASSYLVAAHLLKTGARPPLCVFQVGKSFRRETNDGARASELRFNEFYQMEFQCIYAHEKTKVDYRPPVEHAIERAILRITGCSEGRIVDSDRLPAYSLVTRDVEVQYRGRWKEMCSISTRNDFPDEKYHVLEVAVGLDRLVCVAEAD